MYAIQFAEWPLLVSSYMPFVRACNLCNPPILPCPGKAKLGEDHPDTLRSLNNMAGLLKAQGHLEEAKPLYREALEKSPGAQLQRFQWDFGQWIWSHTVLDLRRVIRFLTTGTGAAILSGYFLLILTDADRIAVKRVHGCSLIVCLQPPAKRTKERELQNAA